VETRPFGSTGTEFPILSFGAQRIVDEHDCREEQAVEILNEALDQGVRYFDTAWIYSYGQSEERVGRVAQHRRQEMWIATKAWDRTRDGALRQLEDSLARLRTDHVDEWRLDNVWSIDELEKCFARDGAILAMREAREQGMVRTPALADIPTPRCRSRLCADSPSTAC
jgi:aryl-alcohol dehydrogenase-like predicted oxidoreductase